MGMKNLKSKVAVAGLSIFTITDVVEAAWCGESCNDGCDAGCLNECQGGCSSSCEFCLSVDTITHG